MSRLLEPILALLLLPFRLVVGIVRFPFVVIGSIPLLGWGLRKVPVVGRLFWPWKRIRCEVCNSEFRLRGASYRYMDVRRYGRTIRVCDRPGCAGVVR